MMYVRFPLSLRNVEDMLHERGLSSVVNWRVFPFHTSTDESPRPLSLHVRCRNVCRAQPNGRMMTLMSHSFHRR
jgi:hypothetical protein